MSYEKQTWSTGDVITSSKLNHMEDGIEASSQGNDNDFIITYSFYNNPDGSTYTCTRQEDISFNDIVQAIEEGKNIYANVVDSTIPSFVHQDTNKYTLERYGTNYQTGEVVELDFCGLITRGSFRISDGPSNTILTINPVLDSVFAFNYYVTYPQESTKPVINYESGTAWLIRDAILNKQQVVAHVYGLVSSSPDKYDVLTNLYYTSDLLDNVNDANDYVVFSAIIPSPEQSNKLSYVAIKHFLSSGTIQLITGQVTGT